MKEKFNPKDWLRADTTGRVPNPPANVRATLGGCPNPTDDLETIISRLESSQTDVTANYSDWRDIGFAFSDELGESGRDYYHRISRFYVWFPNT